MIGRNEPGGNFELTHIVDVLEKGEESGAALPPRVAASAFIIAKDLTLGLLSVGRADFDLLDTVLLVAIVQTNVGPILAQPALQRRFARLDAIPPDSMRRPVSVSALAAMLGLPFETVRRRVRRLHARGVCNVMPDGVMVPSRFLGSELHAAALRRTAALVRDVFERLKQVGFFSVVTLSPPAAEAEPDPLRVIARAAGDYFLRSLVLMNKHLRDATDAFILMQLLRENTNHLPDDRTRWAALPSSLVPDSEKRPATVALVAARLKLSHESVRRRMNRLAEAGLCVRSRRGFIVPAEVLERGPLHDLFRQNRIDMARMFRTLAAAGVVQAWEGPMQAPPAVRRSGP